MIDQKDTDLALALVRGELQLEIEARAALVRILECDEPVPPGIRYQLAALFETNKEMPWEPRELIFRRRPIGRPKTDRNRLMFEILDRKKRGERVTPVIEEIALREGKETNTLEKEWTRFNKHDLPLIEESLPPTGIN